MLMLAVLMVAIQSITIEKITAWRGWEGAPISLCTSNRMCDRWRNLEIRLRRVPNQNAQVITWRWVMWHYKRSSPAFPCFSFLEKSVRGQHVCNDVAISARLRLWKCNAGLWRKWPALESDRGCHHFSHTLCCWSFFPRYTMCTPYMVPLAGQNCSDPRLSRLRT